MTDEPPDFFRGKPGLWAEWFRQPELEIAENVMRLRHCRDMTRGALARKMKMRVSDIAAIESGDHDLTLSQLAQLAKVLGATTLIEIQPVEMMDSRKAYIRWWDRAEGERWA
jgi:transcriptional regulator with XRE-family HTH domain